MIAFQRRASAVLFNVLRAHTDQRPFLLPANVCPIVPATFKAAARRFEFVDIGAPWLAMDTQQCLELVRTNAFGGVLFARPYGSERDPSRFFSALRAVQPELVIIDDKCLCRPDCDGTSVLPLADVTLFSTGRAKFVDLGDGGFGHIRAGLAYRRGRGPADWLDLRVPEVSWDEYRRRTLDAEHAAATHKRELNAIYAGAIPDQVQLAAELQQWRFNIRVPESERLVAELFAQGLFASRHYPPLGEFPVATQLHAEIVNLFNDRYFTSQQARRAAELVVRHLGAIST